MKLIKAIKKLDGFAACNLAEPSPGDLERVYSAYKECFDELQQMKTEVEILKGAEHDCEVAINYNIELNNKNKDLETDIRRYKKQASTLDAAVDRLKITSDSYRTNLVSVLEFLECLYADGPDSFDRSKYKKVQQEARRILALEDEE